MAVELFGPKIAPYAAVACVISFLMTGHRSVYPSQVLAVAKSASFHVEIGKELEEVEAKFQVRDTGLIKRGLELIGRVKGKSKNEEDKNGLHE